MANDSIHDKLGTESRGANAETESTTQRAFPEKLDLHVSLEGIPKALAGAIIELAKPAQPASKLRIFLKDYLPALTPIATVVISVAISIYTYRANDHRSTEALDKTVSEFGSKNLDERSREIAAIRLAAYGDKALPAVKMVLGASDRDLRTGGVLVAQQMYRAQTVDRKKLTNEILGYYAANDRFLRLGVLEWLVAMENQLSVDDSRLAYKLLQDSFGPHGELCSTQDEDVALEAAKFLYIWSFGDSRAFVLGMATYCTGEGAREQAVNTLPVLAKNLSQKERASLLGDDLPNLRKVVPQLKDLIDQAEAHITAATSR